MTKFQSKNPQELEKIVDNPENLRPHAEDGKWVSKRYYTDNEACFKALDPNPLHYRGDFKKKKISEKTGFEKPIAPGMWMISLAEEAIEGLYNLPITSMNIKRFVNPVDLGSYIKCVIDLDEDQRRFIHDPENNSELLDKIDKKMKCFTFNNAKEKESRAFNLEYDFRPKKKAERIDGYKFKRNISGEDYGAYLDSIGLVNGLFKDHVPRSYLASAMISKALINVSEIEGSGLGFYRSMDLDFFDPIDDLNGGGQYTSVINQKEDIPAKNKRDLPQYSFNFQGYNPEERMIMSGRLNISLFKDIKKQ